MNWQQALAEIEGPEFDANLNVVSSVTAFFRAVSMEPAVMTLCENMLESVEVRGKVLDRIYTLSQLAIDPSHDSTKYENPKDVALAVLLWLIYLTKCEHIQIAASFVASAPQCWYAYVLSRWILTQPPVWETSHSLKGYFDDKDEWLVAKIEEPPTSQEE